MLASIVRPDTTEFPPYYATYVNATAERLAATGGEHVREFMAGQCDALEALLTGLADERANEGYAPGKWSLKESIVHICDTERVFAYRVLRIGRGDVTPLASFDQDAYVPVSGANHRTLQDILAEFRTVRAASLSLLNTLDAESIARRGTASGQSVTVRALCWMMAGHAAHHIGLTRDRYLPALTRPNPSLGHQIG